jgi:hypothetical protein
MGSRVLIGVTTRDAEASEDSPGEMVQMFGTVVAIDPSRGVTVQLEGSRDGEFYVLPPDAGAFHSAPPGDYRLRETGEVVSNPDYTTTWSIRRAPKLN